MTEPTQILDPPIHPKQFGKFAIAALATLISWAIVLTIDIQSRFISPPTQKAAGIAAIDRKLTDAAQGEGLFLQFFNFPLEADLLSDFPSQIYARAVFMLYPNRVLVGDPAKPIRSGQELIAGNFNPDPAWLDQFRIHGILRYTYDPNHQSYSTYTLRILKSPTSTK